MTNQQFTSGSPLVALDIEAPDVQTPVSTYRTDNAFSTHLQTYFQTPRPPPVETSEAHGHALFSPHFEPAHSINQSLIWETEAVKSSPGPGGGPFTLSASSPYSLSQSQCELPGAIPTPARDLNQIAAKTQEGWDRILKAIETQSTAINNLTKDVEGVQTSSTKYFQFLIDKTSDNHRLLFSKIISHKESVETEMDKLVKGIKLVVEEELKSSETALLSEIRFMVEQLQIELQKELKCFHTTAQESIYQLVETANQSSSAITKLTTHLGNEETERKEQMHNLEQKIASLDRRLESFLVEVKSTSPSYSSSSPYPGDKSSSLATPNSAVTKSDHIKLTLPTYGGFNDDPDPLSYLLIFLPLSELYSGEQPATGGKLPDLR